MLNNGRKAQKRPLVGAGKVVLNERGSALDKGMFARSRPMETKECKQDIYLIVTVLHFAFVRRLHAEGCAESKCRDWRARGGFTAINFLVSGIFCTFAFVKMRHQIDPLQ